MKINNKKSFMVIACIVLIMFVVTACGGSAPKEEGANAGNNAEPAKTYTFKAGHVLAPDHPYHLGLVKFGELLEEKTKGQIKVDVFPASQLGNERDMIEGLQLGSIDVALTATAPVSNFNDEFLVFDLPYIFRDKDHAYKVLDGEIGEGILAKLETNNIKGLALWESGFFSIQNNKRPVVNPEDLAGMKIRTMENPVHMAFFPVHGANATPMAFGEVFTALQNKTVDGAINTVSIFWTNKFYTVAKYITLSKLVYAPSPLMMSKKTWDSLTPELQQIVKESAQEARDYERKLLADGEAEQIRLMTEDGAEIVEVDVEAWSKATIDKVYPQFVPSMIDPELVKKIQDIK